MLRKAIRHPVRVVAILFAVTVAGVVVACLSIGPILASRISATATHSLGVATCLDQARFSFDPHELTLRHLTIAEPAGYSPGLALVLDVRIEADSLARWWHPPLHAHQITLVAPRLWLERKDSRWNVQVLSDGPSEPDPFRLEVDQVQVEAAHVTLRPHLSAADQTIDVIVPPFLIDNLRASDGSGRAATLGDAIRQVTNHMTMQAIMSSDLTQSLTEPLENPLSPLMGRWFGHL